MRQLFIVRESYVFGDIAIAPVLLFCFHYACTCIVIEWSCRYSLDHTFINVQVSSKQLFTFKFKTHKHLLLSPM